MDWKKLKTGDTDHMNFFSDAESKLTDFYHCLSCYLILGCGDTTLSTSTDANWMIPDLARNQESAIQIFLYCNSSLVEMSHSCAALLIAVIT